MQTELIGETSEQDKKFGDQLICASREVLIIDDDMDAIVPVELAFRRLGCKTSCTISTDDARQRILKGDVDIIVLDWMLGKGTGADLVNKCFFELSSQGQREKPITVITYSGLARSELPSWVGRIFDHKAHWQKPIRYSELVHKSVELLSELNFLNK